MGLRCTKCEDPLTKPFTITAITKEGLETIYRNRVPSDLIDGEGAVMVCLHDNCCRQKDSKRPVLDRREAIMVAREFRRSLSPKGEKNILIDGHLLRTIDGRILMFVPAQEVGKKQV